MTEEEMLKEEIENSAERYARNFKFDCAPLYGIERAYKDGYKAGLHEIKTKWHDLRKNPDDLPELLPPELGYNKLVLCFEWRSDSYGKKAKVYSLDRWNPEPYNEWDNKRHGQCDAWCELPEPPEE